MSKELISVIMSTYNENDKELELSINSILNQTYGNLEFIIINDNPSNKLLEYFLSQITDSRVTIVKNEKNIGLVKSLNKALQYTHGEFIARMDADDVSLPDRLEKELNYLKLHNLDIVGMDIQLIDEEGNIICKKKHFPTTDQLSRKYIKYGTCLAHPTWFAKRKVYDDLNGYREVSSCEDYDFLVRLMFSTKYKVGNIPEIGLQYRIRVSGVSKSSEAKQYVMRSFIAKNRKSINRLTQNSIDLYIKSDEFKKSVKAYEKYKYNKEKAKNDKSILDLLKVFGNKYFYKLQLEKYYLRKRSKL